MTATAAQNTEAILDHHLHAFGTGDLSEVMADYTEGSALITPHGVLRGLGPIREFFIAMFAEFAKPGASFEMQRREIVDDVAYIIWNAETADNVYEVMTDTFVVTEGKIRQQTFAGKIVPKS